MIPNTMTARENLVHTLEILNAPNTTRKHHLIAKYIEPYDIPVVVDGQIMQKHALLRSETLDGAAILRQDVIAAVNEGAKPASESLSTLYDTIRTRSNSVKIPKGTKGTLSSYASIYSEGEPIGVDNHRMKSAEISIIKVADIIEITREMLADAEFDIMAREASAAGTRVGNSMLSIALDKLLTGAKVSTETVSSAATLKTAINNEIAAIEANGYIPTTIQVTPKANAMLRDAILTGYYAGNEAMTLGKVPTLYGLPVYTSTIKPAATVEGAEEADPDVYTPGAGTFGGTNNVGVVIYAKDKATTVAIREDIGFDQPFKDIYKDLTATKVSARMGAAAVHIDDTTNDDVAAAVYIKY